MNVVYAEYRYAECHYASIVMLNVITLNVVLNVIMLSFVVLNVVAAVPIAVFISWYKVSKPRAKSFQKFKHFRNKLECFYHYVTL